MNIIEIQGLIKQFEEIRALDNLDFQVQEGRIFGVIGPDGAGKTTLFRLVASLLVPDEGRISVAGFDTVKEYRKVREIIGYMPGRFSLYMDLTVEENLKFYATVFNTSIEENYGLIRDIYQQIEPFRKRRAGALSGGMKQKLALSCALIHKPRLLILDEPTTGVDAVSRKEFWDMLQRIKKEGISIIVSTPYMDEALRCDEVALLQKGRILSMSSPGEIPDQSRMKMFSVRASGSNYSLMKILRDQPWCESAWLFGQEIHVSVPGEADQTAMEEKIYALGGIALLKRVRPGVEDTFIELMNRQQ